MENTISILRATISLFTRNDFDDVQDEKKAHSRKEEPRSGREADENHGRVKQAYVVDKNVPRVGSARRFGYVVHYYEYSRADDTTEPPHHILQHFIDTYWRQLDKRKMEKALVGLFETQPTTVMNYFAHAFGQ